MRGFVILPWNCNSLTENGTHFNMVFNNYSNFWVPVLWFLSFNMIPPFVFVQLGASSHAYGLLLICVFWFLLFFKNLKEMKINSFIGLTFFLMFFFSIFSSVYADGGLFKPVASFFLLSFLILSCFLVCTYFVKEGCEVLSKPNVIIYIYIIYVLVAVFSINGWFVFGGYQGKSYPVYPFAEPSHFALSYMPISMVCMAINNFYKCFVFIVTCILAFLFPSLTLLVVALIQFFVFGLKAKVLVFYCFSLTLTGFLVAGFNFDYEYFLSRIIFSDDYPNLSNLVYIQGWESAWIGVKETFGIGLGFQNLGQQNAGYFTDVIYSLTGFSLNRKDGAFLAAKVIGEFGLLGSVFVLFVLFNGLQAVSKMSRLAFYSNETLLYYAYSSSMLVEFFVRGFGYFSPTFIIFISLLLNRFKKTFGMNNQRMEVKVPKVGQDMSE